MNYSTIQESIWERLGLFEIFTKKRVAEELIYGSVAGFLICLGGHPFDTLKTNIQMKNSSLFSTTYGLFRQGGVKSFYKGVSGPLVTVPLLNSVIFASYEISRKILMQMKQKQELNLFETGLAGASSGLCSTLIVTPVELVKCKMQVQQGTGTYRSSADCLRQLLHNNGLKGIFQGNVVTMSREVSGNVSQFVSYELIKDYFFGHKSPFRSQSNEGQSKKPVELSGWQAMVCGGFAGLNGWFWSYGADIIKTKVQCANYGHYPSTLFDGGATAAAQLVYKQHGVKGFFLGFNAIMGRAILGNAIGFWGWESSKKYIKLDWLEESKI